MSELFPINLAEQLRCVEREVAMRERVYPSRVATGRMTRVKADYEVAAMRAVAESLRRLLKDD